METNDTDKVTHQLEVKGIKDSLLKECRVMSDFAFANGKNVEPAQIAPLHKEDKDINSTELLPVYNYLVQLIKPAIPGTLVLFEKNRQSNKRFKFLGPLPIVRQFMLLCIISLVALITVSLSPHVNAHSIQLSMLQGEGFDQALRLAFLLSCASVGASFYALFKMNSYINQGNFNMKYSATYWSRYVLGLVAGVLLSELFVTFIDTESASQTVAPVAGMNEESVLSTANYLLKPILAILGGFSASLVYRIFNRLVEAVESIFKGSAGDAKQNMERHFAAEVQENEHRIKSNMTQQVLSLKNQLMISGTTDEVMQKIDATLEHLGNTTVQVNGHVTDTNEESEEPAAHAEGG